MLKSTLLLLFAIPASAANVNWGTLSLTDNNSGAFLSSFTNTATGSVYDIQLPSFSQSDFPTFDAEVDLGITVTANTPIVGITFLYTGTFSDGGVASYTQTAGVLTDSNTFSSNTFSAPFAISGGPLSVDLTAFLNLLVQGGGTAAISDVQITVTSAPEPAAFVMIALGMAGLLLFSRLRRHRSAAGLVFLACTTQSWSQELNRPVKPAKTVDTDRYSQMTPMARIARSVSEQLGRLPNGGRGRSVRFTAEAAPPKPDECDKADEDCMQPRRSWRRSWRRPGGNGRRSRPHRAAHRGGLQRHARFQCFSHFRFRLRLFR